MENNNPDYVYNNVIQLDDADASRKYLAKVFAWMFIALGISAFVALEFFLNTGLMSLINFSLGSAQLKYIISFVFVALMIGLTAYYMQMLKRIGAGIEFGTDSSKKLVLIGAFVLYTTFINLFMSMLRIFGRRN